MPARAAAGDAEFIGVHTVFSGVGAHKAHRAVQVRHDLLDLKVRLRAMHDDEGRVARHGPRAVADIVVVRLPAAADDLDDARTIGLGRLVDVHGQGHTVMLGVNDVADALGLLGAENRDGEQGQGGKREVPLQGGEGVHGGIV